MNLKTKYGKRYRVFIEEGGDRNDTDMMIIPCRLGHIYVHGPGTLGAATNSRQMGRKLAALPGVEVWQDGDDGMNVVFNKEHFDAVAKLMRPRTRRQVSCAQRLILTEQLKRIKPRIQAA